MKPSTTRRPQVVIGFLGTKLDAGVSEKRWDRWRPTVALAGHDAFPVDRIELLIGKPDHEALAEKVARDIHSVRPQVEVRTHLVPDIADPWNFQQVFAALHAFSRTYVFDESCDYFVHLTTGTHAAQICLFLLTEARYFPAKLVETFSHNAEVTWKGSIEVIDLDLSSYDLLAQRFRLESLESQDALKGGIQTRNARFNEVIGRVEKVALRSTAPMLLIGRRARAKANSRAASTTCAPAGTWSKVPSSK